MWKKKQTKKKKIVPAIIRGNMVSTVHLKHRPKEIWSGQKQFGDKTLTMLLYKLRVSTDRNHWYSDVLICSNITSKEITYALYILLKKTNQVVLISGLYL